MKFSIGERVKFKNSQIMFGRIENIVCGEGEPVYQVRWADPGVKPQPLENEHERHLESARQYRRTKKAA